MAACRIFSRRLLSRVSALPGISCQARSFSYDERRSADDIFELDMQSTESFQYPDMRLGVLEPRHRRFPLPGLVGTSRIYRKRSTSETRVRRPSRYDVDILVAELPYERQSTMFEQFLTINKQLSLETANKSEPDNVKNPFDQLDCAAYDCPVLLRKDFCELFPNSDVVSQSESLTVITLSQKTLNNNSSNVKNKKNIKQQQQQQQQQPVKVKPVVEQLVTHFVTAASDICELLHTAGYWADFIDPTSGRPYLDTHTNATIYEIDERYRRCGFEIEDSSGGQCRVLRHHALGSRPFVGCVFTSAPASHPLIANISHHVMTEKQQ